MTCGAKQKELSDVQPEGEDFLPDFWVIGVDVSETEAELLRVPIRLGPTGERFVWVDDIDPQ